MSQTPMKLKALWYCAVLLMVCGTCAAQGSWMLKGADGKWKTFTKETEWRKAAEESGPLETAVITRTDKNISIVYDVQGESGDWRNIDRYLFQPNGALIKLERKFASASEDIMLTQTFEPGPSGALTKKLEREVSLTTKKPKTQKPDTPQLPVVTNMNQLEFMKTH